MDLVIQTNVSQASSVLITDLGIRIASLGGSVKLTDSESIEEASISNDLLNFSTDGAFGSGDFDSTLLVKDGVDFIPKNKIQSYLSSLSSNRGLKRDSLENVVDPTGNDDIRKGYNIGSRWVNQSSTSIFELINDETGNANWIKLGPGTTGPQGLTGQQGVTGPQGITGDLLPITVFPNSSSDPSGPAQDGDQYYNTNLKMLMIYDSSRSKWLSSESATFQFGRNGATAANSFYRGINGLVLSATRGYTAKHNGTVTTISYTRDDTDNANFEITANGTAIATLNSNQRSDFNNAFNADFNQGNILSPRNGSGNQTSSVAAYFTIKWRAT